MKQHGFTLVELATVIAVISIIATISVVAYNGSQARGRDAIRQQDVKTIADGLKLYMYRNNKALFQSSGCGSSGNGNGFYAIENGGSYPKSIDRCLRESDALKDSIVDPSGKVSCSGLTCTAYMKYSCGTEPNTTTYVYAHLETQPQASTDTDGTCSATADSNYGMNYFVKVE